MTSQETCGTAHWLLLTMEGIEHRTTKIATPRTNGFAERMSRTLLDECFRVAVRHAWYITPAGIQLDLGTFLHDYTLERSHQDHRLKGRTAAQTLHEALHIDTLSPIVPNPEETANNDPVVPVV